MKWERSEGPALSEPTLEHYSGALRAYVLPTWKDYRIDSIQREDISIFLNSQGSEIQSVFAEEYAIGALPNAGVGRKEWLYQAPHGLVGRD